MTLLLKLRQLLFVGLLCIGLALATNVQAQNKAGSVGLDIKGPVGEAVFEVFKMLLGEQDYQRHMMAKHRALDDREPLTGEHHERWLGHFMANLEGRFAGPMTDRARLIAQRVMHNLYMQLSARRGHGSGEG